MSISCSQKVIITSKGAQEIISQITSRRIVTKLNLGHNSLQDAGGCLLFQFLSSDIGRRYKISEISLNFNGLGDRTLVAIATYLAANTSLTSLSLQNNLFSGDPAVTAAFVRAVNASHLEVLCLSTNRGLSDAFAQTFFPLLSAPHLRDLQLSAIETHQDSAQVIHDYITDALRCHLHKFSCNANHFGVDGVETITAAVHKNYHLENVSLYANGVHDKALESMFRTVLLRNQHLKREVAREALTLLTASRTLLMPASGGSWLTIPPEVQYYILEFLAPTLSPTQFLHVCEYASTSNTLPISRAGLPKIWDLDKGVGRCVADPMSMGFSPVGGRCPPGTCLGLSQSILCQREEEQSRWLALVHCTAFQSH